MKIKNFNKKIFLFNNLIYKLKNKKIILLKKTYNNLKFLMIFLENKFNLLKNLLDYKKYLVLFN